MGENTTQDSRSDPASQRPPGAQDGPVRSAPTVPDTPVGGDRDAVAEALKQLDKAADQFAFYADQHAAKGTPEAETKASVNHQWALVCARYANSARKAHEAAETRVKELDAALGRSVEHLKSWTEIHPFDCTTETWAILYCTDKLLELPRA